MQNLSEGTSREGAGELGQPFTGSGEELEEGGFDGGATWGQEEISSIGGNAAKDRKRNGRAGKGAKGTSKGRGRKGGGTCARGAKHAAAILHAAQDRAERLQRRRAGFQDLGPSPDSDNEDGEIDEGDPPSSGFNAQDSMHSRASSHPEPEDQVLGLDGRLFLLGLAEVGKNICLASSPSTASSISSDPFKIFHALISNSARTASVSSALSLPSPAASSPPSLPSSSPPSPPPSSSPPSSPSPSLTSVMKASPSIDSLVHLAILCDDSEVTEAMAQLSYFINVMRFACQAQRCK